MAVKTVQAIVNGQTVSLAYNNTTKKYEATLTAPELSSHDQTGGFYNVTLKAEDEAGNKVTKDSQDEKLGSKLKLVVKEKVAPVITIKSPGASALLTNNKPKIEFEVTDNDSGVNADTIKLQIDSGAVITGEDITKTAINKGFKCEYTPTTALSDGNHTLKVDATDYDGNPAVQGTRSFKIDTIAPTLNVTSPVDNFVTNNNKVTVTGKTNDATSSPVTIKVNGAAVTVDASGNFTTEVTLAEGENTITIVATDGAGKSTTVTKKVTLDTTPPNIVDVSISPNPVDNGKTYIIAVEVTD